MLSLLSWGSDKSENASRVVDRQLVERKCAACGATEGKLTRCSDCGKAYYCGGPQGGLSRVSKRIY